ncbi:MAG TPA: hypothetical protein VFO29_00410 [Candidatus Rubrimentiphilum sp.]|nr:hypothetical protein [Candidatus Rubrimentiphilum sp.]
MKRFIVPLLFACAALAGCGSVTSGIDFKAPAGWTTFSLMGRFQMWMKPGPEKDKAQMVFLIRGQTADTMDFKQIPQAGSSIRNQKMSAIKICGNQRAQYVTAVGTSSNGGGDEALEMISAPVGDQSFLAMYIRPQSMKPDPAAETAIRSLCAAKTTT